MKIRRSIVTSMKLRTIHQNFRKDSFYFLVPLTEFSDSESSLEPTTETDAIARSPHPETMNTSSVLHHLGSQPRYDLLKPVRNWLDNIKIGNPQVAHSVARLIPAQCPFERDINLFGHKVAHIPPLCKLNPLYDEFVSLRFRALCYLADECGEDIQAYI
jgi:hypothetical protein